MLQDVAVRKEEEKKKHTDKNPESKEKIKRTLRVNVHRNIGKRS